MAVRIRLQRKGARHMAFYRIVATDSRTARDGRFIEQIGYYDPLKEPAEINVDTERAIAWLGKGAKPSQTVKSLFSRIGIMQTWHEMQRGKSYDELRHIEEEARKRIEAQAAMRKRKKEEKGEKKAAPAAEPEGKGGAAESKPEPSAAAETGEAEDAEPAAEKPAKQASETAKPAAEPAPEEQETEAPSKTETAPEVQEPEKADDEGSKGGATPEG